MQIKMKIQIKYGRIEAFNRSPNLMAEIIHLSPSTKKYNCFRSTFDRKKNASRVYVHWREIPIRDLLSLSSVDLLWYIRHDSELFLFILSNIPLRKSFNQIKANQLAVYWAMCNLKWRWCYIYTYLFIWNKFFCCRLLFCPWLAFLYSQCEMFDLVSLPCLLRILFSPLLSFVFLY